MSNSRFGVLEGVIRKNLIRRMREMRILYLVVFRFCLFFDFDSLGNRSEFRRESDLEHSDLEFVIV